MHLFFNDPRDEFVTKHRRIAKPSLAALVVGGVGVAALGVIVGAAGYDDVRVPTRTEAEAGGFALPVATPGETRTAGPLGMSTVPAAPVPILDLGAAVPTVASPPPSVPARNMAKNADPVRVERSTPMPAQTTPAAAPTTEVPVVVETPPVVAEPVVEDPPEEEPDNHVGRHRWHQQDQQNQQDDQGDQRDQWSPFQNRDGRQWGPWWERR
ncbi:hypothetical protein ACQP00_50985 [Dactylosporangium sp. CS-047395]|uniref:hypothetical protein n=1 Tax=Dactylosporangium sp. CS-047395 TaxID=3239936 RepID=UPI003D9320F9